MSLAEVTPPPPEQQPLSFDPIRVFATLRREIRLVASVMILTAVAAAVALLLRPDIYAATVTLMPNEAKGNALDLGSATDIAEAVGIKMPGAATQPNYPAIVESRRVMNAVLARSFFDPRLERRARLDSAFVAKAKNAANGRSKALRWLRKVTDVTNDRTTGVWTVTVKHESSETAAEIANALVFEAESFRKEAAIEQASTQRSFVSRRVDSTRVALAEAEERLRAFRERNVRIQRSPALLLEEGRLVRDVKVQGEVFLTLTKQYELAKITETWHQPELVVLDRAEPPIEKAGPMRTRGVALAGFAGLFLGCSIALGREHLPPFGRAGRRARS